MLGTISNMAAFLERLDHLLHIGFLSSYYLLVPSFSLEPYEGSLLAHPRLIFSHTLGYSLLSPMQHYKGVVPI